MTKLPFLIIPLALAHPASVDAAIIQYTDRATFLAALPAGQPTADFSSLAPGDVGSPSLLLSGGDLGVDLEIETRDEADAFAGDNLWLSDTGNLDSAIGASTTYSNQLRLGNDSGFYAIGANWFLGDLEDNYTPGSVVLTFSDGSTYTVASTSQGDSFRGFISDIPLTSVYVAPGDPDTVAGWVTIDNLVAVPEPSALLLSGMAGLGVLYRRRDRA